MSFLLASPALWASEHLSDKQINTILVAESVGSKYGTGDLLAAVIGQESSWCVHKHGIDRAGFGCGQLHVRTVREVLGWTVTPEALQHHDYLNIYIAADILQACRSTFVTTARTLYCYNHGFTAAVHVSEQRLHRDKYVKAVLKRLQTVEDINMIIDAE